MRTPRPQEIERELLIVLAEHGLARWDYLARRTLTKSQKKRIKQVIVSMGRERGFRTQTSAFAAILEGTVFDLVNWPRVGVRPGFGQEERILIDASLIGRVVDAMSKTDDTRHFRQRLAIIERS